jgi:hypothetical protein
MLVTLLVIVTGLFFLALVAYWIIEAINAYLESSVEDEDHDSY